ncbi:MAG: D-aminoacylase, partial [Thermoanaerobaculia bacterium]
MLFFAACSTTTTTKAPMLDLKITNGRVVDGTGSPWYRADVGVRGDTIIAIGDLASQSARTT